MEKKKEPNKIKKLRLTKESLRRLDDTELDQVAGGDKFLSKFCTGGTTASCTQSCTAGTCTKC